MNGRVLAQHSFLQFQGVNAVNEVRGQEAPMLASYRTTAREVASGVQPVRGGLHAGDRDAHDRRVHPHPQRFAGLPAADADVYINGLDTSVEGNRVAINAKTVSQSFLVARDACALVVSRPELPTDVQRARMVSVDSYRVAAAHINWFDGDSKQIRDSLLMRIGAAVLEPQAGIVLFGAESGQSALL